MTSKGYVKIGTIKAVQLGNKTSAELTEGLRAAALSKAAGAGGDVVHFEREGAAETMDVPTGKTKRKCLEYNTVTIRVPTMHTVCIPGEACARVGDGGVTSESKSMCTEWGDPVPVTKVVPGVVSAGTVWRYDPNLAADIARAEAAAREEATRKAEAEREAAGKAEAEREATLKEEVAREEAGWTPLTHAAHDCAKQKAELLLADGADVNARDNRGDTALQVAVKCWDQDTAKDLAGLLLAHGADVNVGIKIGWTPLLVVTQSKRWEVAELLLAHGADANTRAGCRNDPICNWDYIPLAEAIKNGAPKDLVELLLSKGADVNALEENKTPTWWAANVGRKDIVNLLRQHGGHK